MTIHQQGVITLTLTKPQQEQLQRAKETGYLITTNSEGNRPVRNAWFNYCEQQNQACIQVRTRKDYASVEVDLIATHLSEKLTDTHKTELAEIFNKYATQPVPRNSVGTTYMAEQKVRLHQAEPLAKELYEFFAKMI